MKNDFPELRRYLAGQKPGELADKSRLIGLLKECWDFLEGGDRASMAADDLDRLESPRWESPLLSFKVELRLETVMGPISAGMQEWTVDLDAGGASSREIRKSVRRKVRGV